MRCFLTLLLLIASAAPALAQNDAALSAQLRALASTHQGKIALYAIDLRSGKTAAIDADTPVPTASVIKLTVLFEALKAIQAGTAHFDDKLALTKADQVPGSGVLGLFDTPETLTLRDALTMMVVVSDNTGTNLAIDHLGLANIDRRIAWMGLQNTWLYKKVFKPPTGPVPADQKQFGLGKTTAREMAEVMERFATCDLNAPGVAAKPTARDRGLCAAAVGMLKNQTDRDGIPRYLSADVANKTGALDDVRNDVGIVYARNGPVIVSEFTYDNKDQSWTPDNAAQVLMARLAKTIVDRWQ
ncbi:MAG TPA: serine hydrolase [Candidatus Baltobacteraceae bacterium]|jgi:beta-lactamase class A